MAEDAQKIHQERPILQERLATATQQEIANLLKTNGHTYVRCSIIIGMKQRVLNATPERLRPLLKGLYYLIYPKRNDSGRNQDPYEIVRNIIDCDSPVIVDGGAHDGRTTLTFQELFTNPTIHAVEPVPSHAEMFRENVEFGENVKLHTKAIGPEENTVSMNIMGQSNSSSILHPSELQSEYRNEVSEEKAKGYQTEEKIEVKQTRIDNLIDEVDIIKLDLQGYELPALHGATDILDSCKAIITEVEFVPYYENQPLFSEVDKFLSEHDFQIFNFSHLRVEKDGQLATTDAVYLHNDVYRFKNDLIYDPKRHK